MLDLLLDHGADINAKSQWWAGGFCLLDSADDELAKHAESRGAKVGVHQAARLGWMEQLRSLLADDPSLVTFYTQDGDLPQGDPQLAGSTISVRWVDNTFP